MDVAAKVVVFPQYARDLDHLLHRVVGALDDARRQKQAFDAVAAVKAEREVNHLLDRETRARHVAGNAVDAIQAVVQAEVGEKNFQQRNAAPVGRIAMANARTFRRADALAAHRIAFGGATGRARGIVLGRVGKDSQFLL